MSDVAAGTISSAALRMVIRAKLNEGISRRAISELILSFVPTQTMIERSAGPRSMRVPVELIENDRRVAFLKALMDLDVPAMTP
jgi:hypothetical protein